MGDCHQLDRPELFDILSDGSPVVECTEPHTTETYQVSDLSAFPRLTMRYPAVEERARIAEEACSDDLVRAHLGAGVRQALYGLWTVAVLPTPDQWDGGARWVRCDLVVVQSETSAFDPVEIDFGLRNAAASDNANFLTRCYRTDEDDVVNVRCSDRHESRDVNMWMPMTDALTDLEIVQRCVPPVGEWTSLGLTVVEGVDGVIHTEENGSLTLRCVAVETYVGS